MSPRPIFDREIDAATLIERLIAPCDGAPTAHGWRKCRRCIAIHLLEQRDPLFVRLLQLAAEQLREREPKR